MILINLNGINRKFKEYVFKIKICFIGIVLRIFLFLNRYILVYIYFLILIENNYCVEYSLIFV